jgi:hypothetical protein
MSLNFKPMPPEHDGLVTYRAETGYEPDDFDCEEFEAVLGWIASQPHDSEYDWSMHHAMTTQWLNHGGENMPFKLVAHTHKVCDEALYIVHFHPELEAAFRQKFVD